MARFDDTVATCLTAIEVERRVERTIKSYRDSLAGFRRVGRRSGLPGGARGVRSREPLRL